MVRLRCIFLPLTFTHSSGLEDDGAPPKRVDFKNASSGELRTQEVQRLARRLKVQQAAVQKTVEELLQVMSDASLGSDAREGGKSTSKP